MKALNAKIEKKINLLPGPIYIHDEVKSVFGRVPISHREPLFLNTLNEAKGLLCELTRSPNVEICLGTGTLANDIIAAQIYLLNKKGLILSNGEFGDRLIRHARGLKLKYQTVTSRWGHPFDYIKIESMIRRDNIRWIWFVHHETSTGMLNDFDYIMKLAKKYKLFSCVDCISSIGALPLNLSSVDLASGSSGKAIGAYPGLSFVFYKKILTSKRRHVPPYLDLQTYKNKMGIPFTSSSNLLSALKKALILLLRDKGRFSRIRRQNQWIMKQVVKARMASLIETASESPFMTTISLPQTINSHELGRNLRNLGYMVHYQGDYLRKRNWVQLASFSLYARQDLASLFDYLETQTRRKTYG